MTASRFPGRARPPSPDPLSRRRGAHPPSQSFLAPDRAARSARVLGVRRGFSRAARGLATAAWLAVLGALALPATAQADVLVSNLGQTFVGSSELRNGDPVGQTFSIATSNDNYTLSSIEITFRRNGIASTDMGSLTVAIWSTHASGTNAGHPKSPLYMLTNPSSVANPASLEAETPATFGAPANATLRAGRTYAVVVVYSKTIANLADAPFWTRTDADDDADPAPGWSIVNARHASAAGSSTWDEDSGEAHKIRVNGTVVPGEVLVSNFGQTLSSLTSALRNGDRLGQTFSIAPTSNDNYTLSSIEIPFQTNGIASTDMGLLTVAIWSTHASGTNAGHPDSPLYTLTNPASITADTTVTFDAPVNSTLRAGRTYAVVVVYSKNIDTADIADAAQWPTVGTGDDADAAPGWSIVDALHASAAGASSWSETSGQARRIRVNGTAIQADALVSNLGQTSSLTSALRNGDRLGQTFSIATGSGNYAPSSIEIPFQTNGIASTDMGLLTVAIWSTHASGTNAGHPDSPLYTLTNPASITADTTATFNAPADSTLAAGRTYAVVVVYSKNIDTADIADAAQWPTVGTGDDADAAPGWSIVDALHASAAGASSWSETSGQARMIRVNGNAAINNAPEFSVDLPSFTLPENSAADTVVGTVTATDADSDTLTYSLEGTDAASFDIVSGTGEIKTVSTATYNYESKKTYSVTVRADDGTDSATVDVAIALTDELEKSAKPAAPTVTAKPATTDSLNVRWTEPGLNGGPDITGYEVEYREGVGNWTDAYDGSALSTIISGLSADTEYEVQVRANNGETPSDWSDSTEATTNAEVITPTCTLTAGDLWCGVVTVDAILFEGTPLGYGFRGTIGDLSDDDGDKMFTFGANSYTIDAVHVATGSSAGILTFSLTSALSDTDKEKAVLHIGSDSFAFDDAGAPGANYHYRWTSSLDWSSETFVTLRLQVPSTLLSGITVNGTSIPGFLADDDAPQYGVSATTTTAAIVATAASASATVAYSDADAMTVDADNVMLSDGANTVIITVTDGSVPATTYTLGVNRAVTAKYGWKADSDFDTLKLAGNNDPRGIWYDAATATFYVSDFDDDKVYAYNTDGTHDSGKDIAVSNYPNGIWSDGTTLWVADSGPEKLFAYTLSSRAADSGEDFDTLKAAGNDNPRGVFSDGTTMWVSDNEDKKLYAYKMSDKSYAADEDFDTLDAAGNDDPRDIWSDGTTMWVSDSTADKLYAYKMSDKSYDPEKDFDTLDAAGNDDPRGLWSHGSILWATDSDDDKLYAYNLPATMTPTNNAPVFAENSVRREVPENSAAGTNVGAAIPEAMDADSGDTLTYSMEGTDVGSFAFNASTRRIQTRTGVTYNYEAAQNSYSVTVKVSDGTDSDTIAVTIDVADVNEKPDKPDKPTLAAVPDSTTSLAASWTKPGLNGGPDITDYDVRFREGTSGGWTDVTHNGDGRTRILAGLAADTAYQAQVRADNGELESDWSDPSDAVRTNAEEVVATVPDAPRDLTATANGEARIDLDWRAPADDGGSAITGYRIEVSDDGGSFFEALATTGAAVTRYAHTGLSAGTTRHYQVYAVNAEGESPASSVGATTDEERQPEGNEPSVIRTYWIGSGGSNDKSGCAGTEEFRAYWNPPLDRNDGGVRRFKVADAWEADITLRGGASNLGYTIQDTGGNPEHPELTGSVRIDGNGWLSMRVRGRFGADGWGGWSPTSSLYCRAASARVDGPLLALTWPTPRDGFAAPDGGDFAVHADGAAVAVTGAALVGRRALLTLGAPALAGQSVSVDYLGSAMHPLADAAGAPVPGWTDLAAMNLTGEPADAAWAAVLALAAAARSDAPGLRAPFDPGTDPASLSLAGIGLADADLAALWSPGGLRLDLRDAPGDPSAGPRRPERALPGDPSALAALRRLDLSDNRLADVSLLADLRGLESLDLSGNALTDIGPLSTLTALRRLDLRGNRVADLSPLASLPRLEVLLLDGNRIADVGALTHLGTLEHLGLSENAVMDLAPLSDLWSLRRLDLGGNPAADLSPLGDLETLEWLRVPAANGVPAHRLIRVRWLWTGRSGVCLGCGNGMR